MGWFNKIRELFKGKKYLLEDGSKSDSRHLVESNMRFRDNLRSINDENLTAKQWQIKFLTENNCSEYIKNPFILKYLISIPEIADIKDAESFKRAKDYNSLFENNSKKQIIYLKGKNTNGENDVRIQFSRSTSKRLKNKTNNIYVCYGNNSFKDAIDRIEYREYDIDSGIEIKRIEIDKENEIQNEKVYTRDTDSIGKAALTEYNSSSKAQITKYNTVFYDLTTAKSSDIGTLDGVNECYPEEYPIEYQSGEESENYDNRLKNKIAKSLNSEACKKYEGILDKAERIQ